MTLTAGRIGAVLFQTRAHRLRSFARLLVEIRLDAGRRRSRRRSDDLVEYPGATQNRRCAIGIRRLDQNRALAQQAESGLVREFHPAELAAGNVRHAIVPRHSIIQIGLIRREQLNQRPVFEQDALNERLGLGDQIPFQLVVEVRVDLLIRLDSVDAVQAKPLHGKVGGKARGSRICKHALDLSIQHCGLAQFLRCGQLEQFFVRARIPQEVGQPSREFVFGESNLAGFCRGGLLSLNGAIEKLGTRQHRCDEALDSSIKVFLFPACFIESHQDSQIRFRRRPAERAARQGFRDLLRARRFACFLGIADVNQGVTQSGNSIRIIGSFDLKERVGVIAEEGL